MGAVTADTRERGREPSRRAVSVLNMRWSWLQNPAVALLSLVASAITVGQSVAYLGRYIYRLTQADGEKYRRGRIAAAVVCLVVVVTFSVVTWPAIMAEAAKTVADGVMGALYPSQMDLLAFVGASMLLLEACDHRRFSLRWCGVLFGGLGMAAMVSSFHSGVHGWVGMVTAAAPGVAIAVITPFVIIRGRDRQPSRRQERRELRSN